MFRFRNWKIYNEARKLRMEVHKKLFPKIPEKEKFCLKPQIQRAVDSIILNIAEGSYRKSDKDLAHFLNQAISSLYEFVAALDLLLDSGYIDGSEHNYFCEKSENLARQISAFSSFLKNK